MSRPSVGRRAAFALACSVLVCGGALTSVPLVADNHELPSPGEVTARFVEALGGEDALRSYSSATTTGTFDMPAMGMSGDMTVYQMAPDKTLTTVSFPGIGESVQGYNGEIAWADDAMQGTRLIEGEMLAQQQREARFYSELEYDEIYPEQTVAGETEWNGQAVYQLDLVDSDGNESSQYFARDTGLLVGGESTETNEMGTVDVTLHFSEYKEFDGVMIPTTTTISMMGMEMSMTFESVSWDDVDPGVFEPSDAVKALLPE